MYVLLYYPCTLYCTIHVLFAVLSKCYLLCYLYTVYWILHGQCDTVIAGIIFVTNIAYTMTVHTVAVVVVVVKQAAALMV